MDIQNLSIYADHGYYRPKEFRREVFYPHMHRHLRSFSVNRRTWIVLGHVCVLLVVVLCFLGSSLGSKSPKASAQVAVARQAVSGYDNPFPQGSCTWWAAQRYYQLTGIYVPWRSKSDAWQWADRAHEFNWKVSSQPTQGAIIDLQPWTQGAYGMGHVAVVEQVLSNGHVIASNMNWGATPGSVINTEFSPGNGVTFISS